MRTARAAGLGMLVHIGWRNVWRNPLRSSLTISALAGGLVMVILYASLLEGMKRQMVQFATEVSTGHMQIQRTAFIEEQDLYATIPWLWLDELEQAFPDIDFAPRMYAAGLASHGETSTGVMIEAVDPQREMQVTSMLERIRSAAVNAHADSVVSGNVSSQQHIVDLLLQTYESKQGYQVHNLVVGAQLARNMDVSVGSELVLVTQAADGSIGNGLYRVAAVLKPVEPGFDRMGVLMSISAWQDLMYLDNGFHELVMRLHQQDQITEKQQALKQFVLQKHQQAPLDSLGGNAKVRNWREVQPAVSSMLELSRAMLLIIGMIVVSLASLGMLNTMLMAIHERTHEFGILLALGMKRRALLAMVVFEAFFLAFVAALAGSLLGGWIALRFESHGIDFSESMPDGYDWAGIVFEPIIRGYLEWPQLVQASFFMMLVAMVTAVIPAWRLVRLKPAEVL